ncbi:Hypothetical predicted protein [Cloeon dipterum]|uniref:Ubiquitin fusion degradation protein UFD1 N-terminal subdomain 1 domain-containing protein n=1 Tax=Cloeon dipterum TaxID=197152 RepID=A0A8S1CPM4_9INSE|nr:Hypothetical predicted protein [Cloeon dipterum]
MGFRGFRRVLRLVPISSSEKFKDDVLIQRGGKIVLDEEHLKPVLGAKYRKRIPTEASATFKLTCRDKSMHCSVLEFSHDKKDEVLVPDWFFKNLDVQIGQKVCVTLVKLKEASFVRLQSQLRGFERVDAEAMLVQQLSRFAAITTGDRIPICFQGQEHDLLVQQTRPANAVRLGQFGSRLELDLVFAAQEDRRGEKREAEEENATPPKKVKSEEQAVDHDLVREARLKRLGP